jgi:hypothetical protein
MDEGHELFSKEELEEPKDIQTDFDELALQTQTPFYVYFEQLFLLFEELNKTPKSKEQIIQLINNAISVFKDFSSNISDNEIFFVGNQKEELINTTTPILNMFDILIHNLSEKYRLRYEIELKPIIMQIMALRNILDNLKNKGGKKRKSKKSKKRNSKKRRRKSMKR